MNLNTFVSKMSEHGDCYINYISPVSKKPKYNIGTTNFSPRVSPYIAQRLENTAIPKLGVNEVLVFCFDLDNFKVFDTSAITALVPLNAVIKQTIPNA